MDLDFIDDVISISESFTDVILKNRGQKNIDSENKLREKLGSLTPEQQSHLLFFFGLMIIELSLTTGSPTNTAIATAIAIRRAADATFAQVGQNGCLVNALVFVLTEPVLDQPKDKFDKDNIPEV